MILKLNNFGKFKNKSFEISNGITLFYGENESGKTTIFDSLMILFSESKRVSVFFKQMKSRYGNDIDIDFEPKIPEHLKMHPQSYNNLYAIRQSEIIFEMSDSKKDSKDWESEIKKKLFSSDIDIGKMVSEIKSEYSSKAQNSILYKINILENEKIEINKILNNLYDKINNSTNKKDNLKEFKENIFLHENILKEKIEEREKLYSLMKSKKESETKSIKLNLLKQINDFNKADEFLSKNIIYKDDYSKEINGRIKKIEDIKMSITFLKGKIEALKKSFVEEKNKTDYDSVKKRIENGINKIEDLTFLKTVKKYCDDRGYDFIWFCKDVEQVYIGKRVDNSKKKNESTKFKKNNLITKVDVHRLSGRDYRIKTSNIMTVLDSYQELKRK